MNSTIGPAAVDRRAVLEADGRDVDTQHPGEDRLVLQPGQRLAAALEHAGASEPRDHRLEPVDLLRARPVVPSGPCARRRRGRRPPERGSRPRPRPQATAASPRGADDLRWLGQQPPDRDRGDHDHQSAGTEHVPRQPGPAVQRERDLEHDPRNHRRRQRQRRAVAAVGRDRRPTAAPAARAASRACPGTGRPSRTPCCVCSARPEPIAFEPATNGLREVSAGIPNHSASSTSDPAGDDSARIAGIVRHAQIAYSPRNGQISGRPSEASTPSANAQRGRPERWQSIGAEAQRDDHRVGLSAEDVVPVVADPEQRCARRRPRRRSPRSAARARRGQAVGDPAGEHRAARAAIATEAIIHSHIW